MVASINIVVYRTERSFSLKMEYRRKRMLLLYLVLVWYPLPTYGADCIAGDIVGEISPNSASNADFGQTGLSLLSDDAVTCTCGVINQWEYYVQTNVDVVYFQVWRDTGGGVYELIGQHQDTPSGTGLRTTPVFTARIAVSPGDVIGWYSPGNSVVGYKTAGSGPTSQTTTAVGALAVGGTHDWSGVASTTGDRLAFHAKLAPGASPSITNLPATTSISDTTAAGFLVFPLVVFDADGDTLTTTMTTMSTEFSFDTTTLQVTTLIGTIAAATYTLNFQVQDPCGKTGTGTLTIIVNNSPLYITSLPSYSVVSQDLVTKTLQHTLGISDASPTDSIAGCTLAAAPKFSAEIVAGTTHGIYSIATPNFDYTTTKKYQFDVTCTDSYGASDTKGFCVYVTPNTPPVFTSLPDTTTLPSTTVAGTSVYTVTATDVDVSDTVTFNAVTCSTATCPFTMNTATGEIQTNANLNTLTQAGYDVYITATDGTNAVGPRILTVKVSGINSAPVIQNTALTFALPLLENSATSTSIYQISASDPDVGDTLTYSAVYTPAAEGATVFSFDTATGLLSTSTSAIVDYESLTSKSFDVDIAVTDGTATDTYATFTVNVVDVNEAPAFGNTIYYVTGNEGNAGESFGNPGFVVTDPDGGATQSYTVDCSAISMDSTSGAVTLSGTYDLDIAGTASVLTCTATVSDGQLTDTTQLIVTINDVNDHIPTFSEASYTLYTTISGNVGETIGSIAATDGDLGIFGAITYTLDQTSLADSYYGVTGTGVIFINKFLTSFGNGAHFAFTATVTDFGGLTDTANVTVVVHATTTVPATTTTERYLTFFEYPPNIAWFTVFCIAAFTAAVTIGYLVYAHGFLRDLTCEDFTSVFRKEKRVKRKPRKKNSHNGPRKKDKQRGVKFAPNDITRHINTKL